MDDDDIMTALEEVAEDLGYGNYETALWFLANKFGYSDADEVEGIIMADLGPVTCFEDMLDADKNDPDFHAHD